MSLELIDTNILIRYFTKDPPDQAARAYRFFQEIASGARDARIPEAVLVEVTQVLSSKVLYNLPRADIKTHLDAILTLGGIKMPHKHLYLRALDLYATTSLDFVDALLIAHAERIQASAIVSFDKDFDRIPGITRREPG